MNNLISTFYSDHKTRKAEVFHDTVADCYFVKYYINDKPFVGEYYPGQSIHWAEDCAENYTLGIKTFDMDYFKYLDKVNERQSDSLHEGS